MTCKLNCMKHDKRINESTENDRCECCKCFQNHLRMGQHRMSVLSVHTIDIRQTFALQERFKQIHSQLYATTMLTTFTLLEPKTHVHSKSDTPETHRAHQKWTQQKNVNKTHVVHKQIALHAQSQSQSLTNANKLSNTTKLNLPKHSHTTNNQMQIPSDHPNVCTPNDLQAANTSRQTSRQTSKQAGKRVPACKRSAPPPGMPGGTPHGCKCYSHLQAAHSWA